MAILQWLLHSLFTYKLRLYSYSDLFTRFQTTHLKKTEMAEEPWYVTSSHVDRAFFVVDLSRLKLETDTLESAMVMYRPKADFKKVA